jgi:hypothetical protein
MGNSVQPAIALFDKVGKKKKTRKKLLKYSFSETPKGIYMSQRHWSCEMKHRQNDNIVFT